MARRNTKADRILNESAMRLEAARMRHHQAQSQLNTAKAVLEAVQAAHDALEKELTAQPRKKAEKPSASPMVALREPTAIPPGLCSHQFEGGKPCLAAGDNAIHDPKGGYAGYHSFEPGKPVARAPRKSKQKSAGKTSIPSSGIETEDVGVAALAASGGD